MEKLKLTFAPHDAGFCEECGKQSEELFTAEVSGKEQASAAVLCRECAIKLQSRVDSQNREAEQASAPEQTPAPETPAGTGKPKARLGRKGTAVMITAVVLVVAVIAAAVIFPKLRSGAKNEFAVAAQSVEKGSNNYNTLCALSAVYNTLFDSAGFAFNASIWGDSYRGVIRFGEDVASSEVLFADNYFSNGKFAMKNGELIVVDPDIKVNVSAIAQKNELLRFFDAFFDKLELDSDSYNGASGAASNPASAQAIWKALLADVFGDGGIYSHRDSAADTLLGLIHDEKLDSGNLSILLNFILTVFLMRGVSSDVDVDRYKSVDSICSYITGKIFQILSAFVAQMPADMISVTAAEAGDSTTYSFSGNLASLGIAAIDYMQNDATFVSKLLQLWTNNFENEGSVTEWVNYLRSECQEDLEDDYYTGDLITMDGYVSGFSVVNRYGDTVFSITLSDINEATVSDNLYNNLQSNMGISKTVDSVDDLIGMMD